MNKTLYDKRALSYEEQLEQLKARGLICDDKRALHYLMHINYYRLSAYIYPLLKDKSNHIFKVNTSFQNVLDLYNFDRELRLIFIDALERIEISLRTNLIYILSHKYNPFWIENYEIFYSSKEHRKNLIKLKRELERSNEKFLDHFKEKYSNQIPPSWITLEVASFGLISLLYDNLKSIHDKKEISSIYNLHFRVFSSWIHALAYIRNISAHHGRLWNRELRVKGLQPKKPKNIWLKNNVTNTRIVFVVAIIQYLLNIINPSNHFMFRLHALFSKYDMIDLAPMGFPKDWENEPLFKLEEK